MRVLQGTQSGFLENLQEHEVHPASMTETSPRHWDKLEPSAATSPNLQRSLAKARDLKALIRQAGVQWAAPREPPVPPEQVQPLGC